MFTGGGVLSFESCVDFSFRGGCSRQFHVEFAGVHVNGRRAATSAGSAQHLDVRRWEPTQLTFATFSLKKKKKKIHQFSINNPQELDGSTTDDCDT